MTDTPQRRSRSPRVIVLAAVVLIVGFAFFFHSGCQRGTSGAEQRAAYRFSRAAQNPLALRAFLQAMPKGADLHMHLTGAVYAETVLAEALRENPCFDPATLALSAPSGHNCAPGTVPAAKALADQSMDDKFIDAISMRGFVPHDGVSGHDHFFAAFGRFNALETAQAGEWVDEVATRAAAQNEQYLEVMVTPPFPTAAALAVKLPWSPDNLAALRAQLLAAGLRTDVASAVQQFDVMDATRSAREHCAAAQPAPACAVTVRYIYQVLRGFPPAQVFAQTLVGFEAASASPHVVGINFVMPEDGQISMRDYTLQMRMLDYLHSVYPQVHISLHAGEISPGLVPPDGLRSHIRQAVELGHASRIGHGVDIMYEDNPSQLLDELAARHILVEINLTSNDAILGVTGAQHPIRTYLGAHVPVALSTDDEGVSRIDLTHEFVRAATEQHLDYIDLKHLVRASVEHSFLPGDDLWAAPDNYTRMVPACAAPDAKPCSDFLSASERARQQIELERRFRDFEASLP